MFALLYLLFPALSWACSCAPSPPLCKLLAQPGAQLETGPDTKIFVGKAISSYPASEREAWDLEKKYAERHPEAAGDRPGTLSREGRKQFQLELWGDTLSAESRATILSASHEAALGRFALSRVEVIEPFSGAKAGEIVDMFGGLGGADCSFHFKPGATYLLVAKRWGGLWGTSACSRSKEITGTNPELEALRAWRDEKPVSNTIFGFLYDSTERGRKDWNKRPRFPIRLNGPSGSMSSAPDPFGQFRFDNVAPGEYRLDTAEPGWALGLSRIDQTILVTRGCEEFFVSARQLQSSLSGRVQPSPGQTLVSATIKLMPVTPQAELTNLPGGGFNNQTGDFRIGRAEPGDYVLAINPENKVSAASTDGRVMGVRYPATYYPGVPSRERAEVIRVERGEEVRLPAIWILPPPLAEKKIEGIAVWPDGKPAAETRFLVKDQQGGHTTATGGPASADGLLTFNVLEGRSYRIEALTHHPDKGLYFCGAADIGPEFAGKLVIKLAEDGPNPRYIMMWGQRPIFPKR